MYGCHKKSTLYIHVEKDTKIDMVVRILFYVPAIR